MRIDIPAYPECNLEGLVCLADHTSNLIVIDHNYLLTIFHV